MSAPTPISALLHSSTMVIAGIYLLYQLYNFIYFIFYYYYIFFILFILLIILTLLYSSIKTLQINDIKSIIAYSTVSQLSYMFIGLLIYPSIIIYHISVHALFKSILFLLSGIFINYSNSYQSIYSISLFSHTSHYSNSSISFIKIIFILCCIVLSISISKELIISSVLCLLNSYFIFIVLFIGSLFTSIYSIRLYLFMFHNFNFNFNTNSNISLFPTYLFITLLFIIADYLIFHIIIFPIYSSFNTITSTLFIYSSFIIPLFLLLF